jgi:hypothetical protein
MVTEKTTGLDVGVYAHTIQEAIEKTKQRIADIKSILEYKITKENVRIFNDLLNTIRK